MIDVRPARPEDAAAMADVADAAFADSPDMMTQGAGALRAQMERYPQGQLVAVERATGRVVASASSLRLDPEVALARHDWWDVVGGMRFANHDPEGDVLYGAEMSVAPEWHGRGVGRALYAARRSLVLREETLGFATGGRMPGYHAFAARGVAPEDYVRLVERGEARDPVLSFQLAQGMVPLDVLPRYLTDAKSAHYACLVFWPNPLRADARELARSRRALPGAPAVGATVPREG